MAREMRNSEIEWVGEMPASWKVNTAFQFFSQVKNKNTDMQEKNLLSLSYGKIKRKDIDTTDGLLPESFDGYNIIEANDIVLRLTDLQNDHKSLRVGLATERGIVTSAYLTLRNQSDSLAKYLYYYLHAFDISKGFYGMGAGVRQGLNWDGIKWLKILTPSIQEQKKIVELLDNECSRIESVIEQTRASIDDYKRLKQATIATAVTKGIRSNRQMKDSGIEWVGEMPEEWESINPKALFSQRKDKAKAGERQLTASQQFGVIYQDEYMKKTGNKIVTVEKDFDILKHVEVGDFVISMRSFQGGLEYSNKSGSISSAYVMLVPNLNRVFPRYYRWLLKSSVYINALQSTTNMVRDGQAMRYANFVKVRLFFVPLEEQKEIADYLDVKCVAMDKLIEQKEQLIVEMDNYKKSLIYEYVTGKREVM